MGSPRPVLVIAGRHRPHELLLLALSLLLGLAYTLGSPPPESVAAQMPPPLVHVWSVGLLLSGLVGLVGVLSPVSLERGLSLELGAMLLGAAALTVTTAAVFNYAGAKGLFGGAFSAAWVLANVGRSIQIVRDLREVR